ncbi:hypothetical protein L3073_17295 [Ancylomarina sp. DW003]|nr:hypothetical protein [Ancylomarina sp. DW003]MDE5423973.1 hypothetical protein [Ancylomarina sp. DW003]
MKYDEQKYLGYLKYYGKKVDEGFLDAKKAANALIGFDEILRYFIYQESSSFQDIDFEIPVKIKKGSWLVYIPETIQEWLLAAGGLGATAYVTTAAKKLAENDFKEIGFKTVFKNALKSICWVIKLASHLKSTKRESFENLKFQKNNTEVGILNENGELLFVPVEALEHYKKCPDLLFSKVAEIIEEEREMEIGLQEPNGIKAIINNLDKNIFYKSEDENDEIVLPELIHGQRIELEGHTTRGNEKTNTLGFLYADHVLTCKPQKGSIVSYKINLFDNCLIKGIVDRLDKNGNYKEKKPQILFDELVKIKPLDPQQKLF